MCCAVVLVACGYIVCFNLRDEIANFVSNSNSSNVQTTGSKTGAFRCVSRRTGADWSRDRKATLRLSQMWRPCGICMKNFLRQQNGSWSSDLQIFASFAATCTQRGLDLIDYFTTEFLLATEWWQLAKSNRKPKLRQSWNCQHGNSSLRFYYLCLRNWQ